MPEGLWLVAKGSEFPKHFPEHTLAVIMGECNPYTQKIPRATKQTVTTAVPRVDMGTNPIL